MARINKQEVLQEMQEGLRLDTAREKTPQELAEKVLPVYKVNPQPRIIVVEDIIANDNNKTFIVPPNKKWKLLYGFFSLQTTATVGNRRMDLLLRDVDNNIIYFMRTLNVQIANSTERYIIGQFGDISESVATFHHLPIPVNTILITGQQINIEDSNAIDNNDDLAIRLIIEESDMNPQR